MLEIYVKYLLMQGRVALCVDLLGNQNKKYKKGAIQPKFGIMMNAKDCDLNIFKRKEICNKKTCHVIKHKWQCK